MSTVTTSNLAKKTVIVTAIVSAINLLFLGLLLLILDRYQFNLAQERKARDVLSIVAQLTTNIQFATGALVEQNRDVDEQEQNQREVFENLTKNYEALKLTLGDDPSESKRLDNLAALFERSFQLLDRFHQSHLSRKRRGGKLYHDVYIVEMMDSVDSIEQELGDIEQKYGQIESASDDLTKITSGNNVYYVLIGAFVLNAICTVLAIVWFLNGIGKRINKVCNNTINLGLNMPLLPESDQGDEISQLDLKFRNLADYLSTAKSRESLILEHAADFICLLDNKGVIASVSERSATILGYTTTDLVGRRLLSLLSESSAETLRLAQAAMINGDDNAALKLTIKRGNGTNGEFDFRMRLTADEKVICIATDITEQNAIESGIAASADDYRIILDSLPLAVLALSQSGLIEDVNAAGQTMTGYNRAELVGKPLEYILTDKDAGPNTSQFSSASKTALPQLQVLNGANGQQNLVEVSLGSYVEGKSGAKCSLFALKDVSVQEQIESAKRDFINMIGHDLRSPLMSLYCTVNMIAESSPIAEMQNAEKILQDLIDLTTDFLSLGKLESNQVVFDFAATTVSKLMVHLLQLLSQDERFKNLDMQVKRPLGDATVILDSEQIISAVSHLLLLVTMASLPGASYRFDFELKGESFVISVLSNSFNAGNDLIKGLDLPYSFFIPANLGLRGALCLGLVRTVIERHQGRLESITQADQGGKSGLSISLPLQERRPVSPLRSPV